MSTRLSRPHRRRDTEPLGRVLRRSTIVAALLAGSLYLAFTIYSGVPLRDYRYVEASVPDPGSLIPHDPVRIAGARVGQVDSVEAEPGGGARLRLQLAPGTALSEDTEIQIRANGLLGARYVELRTGDASRELADGAVIRGDETTITFGVTDALDVLDRPTRERIGTLLDEAALGVRGQGRNVNDALRVAGDVIDPSADLFAYLRRFPQQNGDLFPALAAAATPLDANRHAIARLTGATASGLAPIPDRREATRATIAAAPGALAAADRGLGRATPLLREAGTLAAEVRRTLPPVPRALREINALLDEARRPLVRAATLLDAARPAVPAILRITASLQPVLEPVRAFARGVIPIVEIVAPYGCDIENLGVVMRSMTGLGSRAPGGPGGPPMQFRLTPVTATGYENLGLADPTGVLTTRESYPPPCKYLSTEYPIIDPRKLLGGAK